ncbi:DUF6221 family protein [Amycolatopsis sp., V23-08]|uniref:DUF6221 family protein n=1 Tax=Amycolatopsis heterodermiae TaxID=3110235 RepID=A0ABU5RN34_9PSEU|nr:DUF6221 family protein [Amycolatopsis sp., V23-08]MEA5367737.1 DUF6221 family protein [Amycolatopsis sp., V23-08]
MDEFLAWLTAQLDNDERAARAAAETFGGAAEWQFDRLTDDDFGTDYFLHVGDRTILGAVRPGEENAGPFVVSELEHIARHDPARALRRIGAARRAIQLHQPGRDRPDGVEYCLECGPSWRGNELVVYPCETLRLAAVEFDDRQGYRGGWQPEP